MKQFFAVCPQYRFIGLAYEVVTGPAITLDKDVHDYGNIQQGRNGT